jgi:hypothetical protein
VSFLVCFEDLECSLRLNEESFYIKVRCSKLKTFGLIGVGLFINNLETCIDHISQHSECISLLSKQNSDISEAELASFKSNFTSFKIITNSVTGNKSAFYIFNNFLLSKRI